MPRFSLKILLLLGCTVCGYIAFALYTREARADAGSSAANQRVDKSGNLEQPQVDSPNAVAKAESTQDSSDSELLTFAPEPAETTKCKIYRELRNFNFRQPALKSVLCSGVEAYVRVGTAYPMCQLPKPFDERIMAIVRSGSDITDLLDMKKAKVNMYVYPEKDYISEAIKKSQQWEPQLVHPTLRLAQKVPNATFLDAGCNIGVYSVLAARLGLPVVALDANIRNLLRLRLTLSAASLDASLVWNFIGAGDQLSYLNFPADCNVGGATKFGRALRDTIPVMPVRSESLCSLIKTHNIVIKLDVEGGEADFLRTSGRLFSDFKVAAVQMEFLERHMVGNDSSTIVDFFVSRRFSAWRIPGFSELDTKAATSWVDGDLMWVHEEFKGLVPEIKGT